MIKMKSFTPLTSVHWLLQGFALILCVSGKLIDLLFNNRESNIECIKFYYNKIMLFSLTDRAITSLSIQHC